MGVAARLEPELDAAAWLAVHTGYCIRHRARLTPASCQKNQSVSIASSGDLRCAGCGGLDNQPEPMKPTLTLIHGGLDQNEHGARGEVELPGPVTEQLPVELWGDTDQEEDATKLDLAELVGVALESLDPLIQQLLQALHISASGAEAEDAEPEQIFVELPDLPERRIKVAVFAGRCIRCDGAMLHAAREQHDDEVYRCFNCGWHTSPGYEENRRAGVRGW